MSKTGRGCDTNEIGDGDGLEHSLWLALLKLMSEIQ